MIDIEQVSGGYSQEPILRDISLHIDRGSFFGIIGPNGSGKTTLVKMISGILPLQAGEIQVAGKSITAYQSRELAKKLAVLPQLTSHAFSFTVKETVSLGRYAFKKGLFQTLSDEDGHIIAEVMEQTGVTQYADSPLDELSGGEKQRVFLAQALAQTPEIMILDEPTNHLDLAYQKELLDLLKDWTEKKQLTVISIFHDLNLAGLYCDKLLLLNQGKMSGYGQPDEVLKADKIQQVYHTEIEKYPHPRVPKPQMMLVPEQSNMKACNIDESMLKQSKEHIVMHVPIPLKSFSSAVTGSGMGWFDTFVNRYVDKNYQEIDHKGDMEHYLRQNGFDPNATVGMMTAVPLDTVAYLSRQGEGFSLFVVVTAGVGNAVDAAYGSKHVENMKPGTINTWIFINGNVTDEAYIQGIVTATEAKTKALRELHVMDKLTGTFATGTSTDSILIAASQQGEKLTYGGPIAPLGQLIGNTVYECTKQALKSNFERRNRE